jgi:hypothetical protein
MPSFLDDPLLTPQETAEVVRRPENWLAKKRIDAGGPPFLKIGGKIRYRRSAVLRWLEQQERTSTSDPGPAARADAEPGAGSPARRTRRSASTRAA